VGGISGQQITAALKACNSRYRDIIIDQSEEMEATLESIPDELIRRATVVGDESEIQIDRLVHQQAQTPDTMNDINSDDELRDDPLTYPMSLLTRSGCPEQQTTSASATALTSNILIYNSKTPLYTAANSNFR
jgi:hypothetical protein